MTVSIFNTSYALSKGPHLHRACVIGGCIFFLASCKLMAKKLQALLVCTIIGGLCGNSDLLKAAQMQKKQGNAIGEKCYF